MKDNTKKFFFILSKAILTVGLFVYLIYYISPNKIENTFRSAKPWVIILILILLAVNIWVQFVRWGFVSSKMLGNNNKKEIFSSLFHGFAWGIITPLRAGEFFARKIPMKNKSVFNVVTAAVVEKFFLMPAVFLVGGIFALFFVTYHLALEQIWLISVWVLFLLASALVIFVLFNYRKAKRVLDKMVPPKGKIRDFYTKLENLSGLRRSETGYLLLLSVLLYFIYTLQFALSIFAFTNSTDFFTCYWISNLVIFSKNFVPPVTLGEVGVRETITIYFAGKFGLQASAAFNGAVLIFLINILLPALIGLYFVLKEKQ